MIALLRIFKYCRKRIIKLSIENRQLINTVRENYNEVMKHLKHKSEENIKYVMYFTHYSVSQFHNF